jgi:hypothetical protein
MNVIRTNTGALKTWLVDLSGNIAVSGADIPFLDVQITGLENKCSAYPGRIDEEVARETLRRQRLAAAPKQESNFKLGQSIGLLFEEIESWNMEQTLTQSGALYLAQHKIAKRRSTFFRRFNVAARKQTPDIVTFGDLVSLPRYRDNGRWQRFSYFKNELWK